MYFTLIKLVYSWLYDNEAVIANLTHQEQVQNQQKVLFSCNWNNLLFYEIIRIFKGLFGYCLGALCVCSQRLCKAYTQLLYFFFFYVNFYNKILFSVFHFIGTGTRRPTCSIYCIFFASNTKTTCTIKKNHGSNNPGILISKIKSNLRYTRKNWYYASTSGGSYLRGLALGQHSYEETSQRSRTVGDAEPIWLALDSNLRHPAPTSCAQRLS